MVLATSWQWFGTRIYREGYFSTQNVGLFHDFYKKIFFQDFPIEMIKMLSTEYQNGPFGLIWALGSLEDLFGFSVGFVWYFGRICEVSRSALECISVGFVWYLGGIC